MKRLGLLGGMSWESTLVYYRRLNELTRQRLGGLHSTDLVLHSVDFAAIEALQTAGHWDAAGAMLAESARGLVSAGADVLLLCTNTMHKVADQIADAVPVPLIHIVDATADAMQRATVRRPLLLATRYTMEDDFYRARLSARYDIEAVVPDPVQRETVHRIIFEELCLGEVSSVAKHRYLDIIDDVSQRQGIDGVILGCTEIGLLIRAGDLTVPVFDSTEIHVRAGLAFALDD